MLRYFIFFMTISVSMAQSSSIKSGLVYRITADKERYIHGEPIVVTAILSNASDRIQDVRMPSSFDGIVEYDACLADESPRRIRTEPPNSDSSVIVKIKPKESVSNSVGLKLRLYRRLYRNGRIEFLPVGAWHVYSYYHFEPRTSPSYYESVIPAESIRIDVLEPDGEMKVEYDEFMSVMGEENREEKLRKLLNYIDTHKNGVWLMPAIEEAEGILCATMPGIYENRPDRTLRKPFYESLIMLSKAIRQMNAASEDYDMATSSMVSRLEALGRTKDAFDAIDDISLKRSGRLREKKDELRRELERDAGVSK
jgi:hypothetical protein